MSEGQEAINEMMCEALKSGEEGMTQVIGTVEAISTKWDKFSVKIGEKWYGTKDEFYKSDVAKNGGVGINVGDTITFNSGATGKYMSNWRITGAGSGTTSTAEKPAKAGGGYSTVGVAVGAAMNQAVQLHGVAEHGVNLGFIEDTAMGMYELAERLKEQASAGDIRQSVEERNKAEEELALLKQPFAD
ncbi:hypothetical protein OAO19_03075 [Gammaproteobacteria bacterium]|nr:hypothetical protein [Gammaproteobacteria bacterium]